MIERNMTSEEAYQREQIIEHKFCSIALILKDCNSDVIRPMLLGLENDAIQWFEGWGVRLFFFLKGIQASNVISEEQFDKCMNIFDEYIPENFIKYTEINL
jgi:hypothetical protein